MRSFKSRIFLLTELFIVSVLLIPRSALLYGQQDNLEVKGTVNAGSLTIKGGTAFPVTPVKGEVFYRSDEDTYYAYDGSKWDKLQAGERDRRVATRIIANSDYWVTDTNRADKVCGNETCINEVINELPATGGVVYLLRGTYYLSGSINLKSNVSLIGAGRGTVLKIPFEAGGSPLTAIYAQDASNILVSQLTIDGVEHFTYSDTGIQFNNVSDSKIDSVRIDHICGPYAIHLQQSNNNIVTGNVVSETTVSNILFPASGSSISVSGSGNIISENEVYRSYYLTDIYINGSDNVISGNNLHDNSFPTDGDLSYAIYVESGSYNTISGNKLSYLQTEGIAIFSYYNTISGNTLSRIGCERADLFSSGCTTCSTENTWNIHIEGLGNVVTGNNVDGTVCSRITSPFAYGIVVGGSYHAVSGNYLKDAIVSVTSEYSSISNNYFVSYHDVSDGPLFPLLTTNSGSKDNYISGNRIVWYTCDNDPPLGRAKIKDQGVNTIYTDNAKITLQNNANVLLNGDILGITGPTSYVCLYHAYDEVIRTIYSKDGIAPPTAGDILILENGSSYNIRVYAGTTIKLQSSYLDLSMKDTLTLLWNGSAWIQIGYSSNTP